MSTVRSTRLIRVTAITILMITAIIVGHGSAITAEAQAQQPSRPTGLTATASQGDVQLSWNDPQDSTITHYKVFRRNVSPGVQDTMQRITGNTGSNAATHTDSTAEPATRYKYKVTAVNAEGQSRRSRPTTITTPPGQVQDVSATQQDADTDVVITWTSLNAATKYQVERETTYNLSADPVMAEVTAPVSSYSDSSTEYATEYLYRIRAGSDAGYGEWSDLDRITTHREPSTPAAPARVGLSEADAGSVVITWQDPPGDEAVNGYRIYRKTVSTNTDEQLATTDGTTTTYTDSTVAEEAWYTYWIVAHNDVGDSPQSSWQSIETKTQTPNVPHEPTGLTLSEDTAGEVVIAWTAPDDGPTPTGYKVYRANLVGSATPITTVNAQTLTYTDTTVETDHWYRYYVKAYNDVGDGTKSRTRFIRTDE